MEDKIDFVIAWVDGSDPVWLKEKNKYLNVPIDENSSENRYRDMDCLRYWFRAVEKYVSWVNKIYFITWGHIPEWLDINNEKIVIVNHKDYIPSKYLPTFSSHVIELNLHRIKNLSDKFVYFNDDMFICDYMSKEDFFKNGLPREYAILSPIIPSSKFEHIVFNNIRIINNNFNKNEVIKKYKRKWINKLYGKENIRTIFLNKWNKICGFKESHLPTSFLKSTFEEVWSKETEILNQTSLHKFRTLEDVNQWLIKYWQVMSGNFEPRKTNIGKRFELGKDDEKIIDAISNQRYKLICINDADIDYDFKKSKNKVVREFEKKLTSKSKFEK